MPLPLRIGRLRPPVLCLVVGRDSVKGDIEKIVADALAGGVSMVQLREKGAPAGELVDLARRLRRLTRGKALLVINDRVDVAMAVDADGVQLPEDGLPTLNARGLISPHTVLGRSVHNVDSAVRAAREGAEFLIAGTVYKSPSKPEVKPSGVSLIKDISKAVQLPVLAIGGVTAARVDEVIKAGAAGVAVISAIAEAPDPKAAAEELKKALADAWASRAEAISASA